MILVTGGISMGFADGAFRALAIVVVESADLTDIVSGPIARNVADATSGR